MVQFRRVRPEEMPEVMLLVMDVFDREQEIPREMNIIPEEKSPVWWCAVEEEEILGTIASYREGEEVHLGRYTIRPERRGEHLGTKLMEAALDDLFFEQGVEVIHGDAREQTKRILLRLGGEVTGEPFDFYVGTCTPMVLERAHYRKSQV